MKTLFHTILLIFVAQTISGQTVIDSLKVKKEFTSLEEALKNPEKVYNLNLSNQNVAIPKEAWSKFINLEILSFKNDHLKEIPQEIGFLKNLKVLDLSGNDFTSLPKSFSELNHLEELFLNDDKNLQFDKNKKTLNLPINLRILHLEQDNLNNLPKEVYELKKLESLFLNNNNFIEVPKDLKGLKNLRKLDFHDNKIPNQLKDEQYKNQNFGFKIIF
jgi:Leucine-rich repeat (LRR) protein